MATSGTTSTTVFETQKIIDHAFRRCKLTPQQVTQEHIDAAKDLLWLITSMLVNKGIKLWNVDRIILPLYESEYSVQTPVGVVDVLDVNLRTNQRITGTATATEGTAANAFDGDLTTACTQVTPAGSITMELTTATKVPIFGVLPEVSGTWDYIIEFSDDGVTYTPIITKTSQAVVAGEWIWEDVEGVLAHTFYRLRATGTTVLDVTELVYQNLPQEIPLYQLNRTDYSNLPNKTRTGRPTQFWWDKQRTQGVITVWPNVDFQFTFSQLVCYVHTYLEDVGTIAQELEVPQRWYEAIIALLAQKLVREIKDADDSRIPILDADADRALSDAWTGETDNSDVFLRPQIRHYTI